MSLFELSSSCETADGSAIKLVDIQQHPIRTKHAITNARDSYLRRKLKPSILFSDLYLLRIQKKKMSLAHNTYSKLIQQHDKLYWKVFGRERVDDFVNEAQELQEQKRKRNKSFERGC